MISVLEALLLTGHLMCPRRYNEISTESRFRSFHSVTGTSICAGYWVYARVNDNAQTETVIYTRRG